MVCSTTEGALARPTVATITPRSVAAATSMLSMPTPWREMILRFGAASIIARGIFVRRTQIASAPGRKLAHAAGSGRLRHDDLQIGARVQDLHALGMDRLDADDLVAHVVVPSSGQCVHSQWSEERSG